MLNRLRSLPIRSLLSKGQSESEFETLPKFLPLEKVFKLCFATSLIFQFQFFLFHLKFYKIQKYNKYNLLNQSHTIKNLCYQKNQMAKKIFVGCDFKKVTFELKLYFARPFATQIFHFATLKFKNFKI